MSADVVATTRHASPASPLLVLDVVEAFLDRHGLGQGELRGVRIGEGQSNVTFLLERGPARYVLRRGPRPPLPRSTHDMVREARILSVLRAHGAPVPEVLAVCEDESLLGLPFYIAEYIEGFVLTDTLPDWMDLPASRERLGGGVVDALVRIHGIDIADPAVAALGRPEGYLRRQVERFRGLWDSVATRDLPAVDAIGRHLETTLPVSPTASIVHGDFRLGNVMLHPTAPVRVHAVLDWEMSTLGDPLADVGYLSATWGGRDRPATVLELTPVTRLEGFPSRSDVVEAYASQTGLDVSGLAWYEAFALFKGAVFCEAIYRRWCAGERPADDDFGPLLRTGVPGLLNAAADLAGVRL